MQKQNYYSWNTRLAKDLYFLLNSGEESLLNLSCTKILTFLKCKTSSYVYSNTSAHVDDKYILQIIWMAIH
jgi:hypothetical protein